MAGPLPEPPAASWNSRVRLLNKSRSNRATSPSDTSSHDDSEESSSYRDRIPHLTTILRNLAAIAIASLTRAVPLLLHYLVQREALYRRTPRPTPRILE
jgi:hypothetical protein